MHVARYWLVTSAIVAAGLLFAIGCDDSAARRAAIEKAEAQVRRVAADLDKRTTETGVYVRVKEDEIQEDDPWGTPVQVSYSQGGVAEVINVRSAGPDRQFHTTDDLLAQGIAANLKGIGEGIQQNAEETAAKAAKGLVKGAVEGLKDSFKDASPFKKHQASETDPEGKADQPIVQPESNKPVDSVVP